MEFPHADILTSQKELFWRDYEFLNTHINQHKWEWAKQSDIIDSHRASEDFCHNFETTDSNTWDITIVEQGEGDASADCVDLANGVVAFTNDAADDDSFEVASQCECWKFADCYPLYFEFRFKVSDGLQSDFWMGLLTGNTYFTPPDDYALFKKDDGDRNLDFANAAGGAGNDVDTTVDIEDLTWYRIGMHFDGEGNLRWFVFRDSDQICLATGKISSHITEEELAFGWGIRNGEAEAKILYLDYFKIVQKRVIED